MGKPVEKLEEKPVEKLEEKLEDKLVDKLEEKLEAQPNALDSMLLRNLESII